MVLSKDAIRQIRDDMKQGNMGIIGFEDKELSPIYVVQDNPRVLTIDDIGRGYSSYDTALGYAVRSSYKDGKDRYITEVCAVCNTLTVVVAPKEE